MNAFNSFDEISIYELVDGYAYMHHECEIYAC